MLPVSKGLFAGLSALAVATSVQAAERQSVDDAWWTGSILATNPNTLPPGHVYIEPYVFDISSTKQWDAHGKLHSTPRSDTYGSQSYVNYGLADRFTVGMIPRFAYTAPSGGPDSSHLLIGDVTLQAQYQLNKWKPTSWVPALGINIQETLPTGPYDHLSRASNGFGGGAYTTTLGLYSQTYFWMPTGRILRTRLDVDYGVSSSAKLSDLSVYGTTQGFRGKAQPGDVYHAYLGFEYSVTRSWVLALDVAYEHDNSTSVNGRYPILGGPGFTPFSANTGSGYELWVAPAVEYNFNSNIGVIAGVRLEPDGRNASQTVTPVAALSMFF